MRARRLRGFALSAFLLSMSATAWGGGTKTAPPSSSTSPFSHADVLESGAKVHVYFSMPKLKEALAQQKLLRGTESPYACAPGNLIYGSGPVDAQSD